MKKTIYTDPSIHSSEITPEPVFLNRRNLMKSAGALASGVIASSMPQVAASTQALAYAPDGDRSLEDDLTPFKAVTTYNNFYEFGTDKDDPARYAESMTIDPWSVKVGGLVDQPGQLFGYIAIHVEMRGPRRFGRIEIKPRALAEIVGVVIRHIFTARAGIRRNDHQAELGGNAIGRRLGGEIVFGTGQPRQPVHGGHRAVFGLWRYEHGKPHVAGAGIGSVAVIAERAAVDAVLRDGFHILRLSLFRRNLHTAPRS